MQYSPNYAGILRCIGQVLDNHEIEAFEISTYANEFRLVAGDPNPPYTAAASYYYLFAMLTKETCYRGMFRCANPRLL